jgi:DNA-binding GntR family transcriptional regulator
VQHEQEQRVAEGASTQTRRGEHVKRLRRESLREDILRAIKTAILTAELEDGQLYTMTELAERFGASRTPVREALLELEKRGLVEIIRSVGFRVTAPTLQDLRDMLQIREWLEVPALVAITGLLSPAALRQAENLLAELEVAAQAYDIPTFHELDRQFHVHLVAQTGNAKLAKIVDEAREIQWVPGLRDALGSKVVDRNREHRAILTAIKRAEPERVERLILAHLDFSRKAWGVPGR